MTTQQIRIGIASILPCKECGEHPTLHSNRYGDCYYSCSQHHGCQRVFSKEGNARNAWNRHNAEERHD